MEMLHEENKAPTSQDPQLNNNDWVLIFAGGVISSIKDGR